MEKRKKYQTPDVEIICFTTLDVLTVSGVKDKNQGEWDIDNLGGIK